MKKTSAAPRRPAGSRSTGRKRKEGSVVSVVFSPVPVSNIKSGKPSESEVRGQTGRCVFVCVTLSLMDQMAQRAGDACRPAGLYVGEKKTTEQRII